MRLTTVPDPPKIFPIRCEYNLFSYDHSSIYVANVTAHTTGKLLLENLHACNGYDNGFIKLVYNDKDIRLTDTVGELEIKVNVCKYI